MPRIVCQSIPIDASHYTRRESNDPTETLEIRDNRETSLHIPVQTTSTDPELQRLIDAWPDLSAAVKRMILAALEAIELRN